MSALAIAVWFMLGAVLGAWGMWFLMLEVIRNLMARGDLIPSGAAKCRAVRDILWRARRGSAGEG